MHSHHRHHRLTIHWRLRGVLAGLLVEEIVLLSGLHVWVARWGVHLGEALLLLWLFVRQLIGVVGVDGDRDVVAVWLASGARMTRRQCHTDLRSVHRRYLRSHDLHRLHGRHGHAIRTHHRHHWHLTVGGVRVHHHGRASRRLIAYKSCQCGRHFFTHRADESLALLIVQLFLLLLGRII